LSVSYGDILMAIPVAYMTVYAGLLNPYKFNILKGADYSYGVFLYGYPIQQAFASSGKWTHYWWLNILVCVPLAFLVAAFSWHFVEKPVLFLKKKLVVLVFGSCHVDGVDLQ
jgi:peptidoglycan/LPS O-acetylase OafA/YrhL